MYFFIEQSNQLKEKSDSLQLDYNDIYVQAMSEIAAKYSLPYLHEWGDGYCQGDATDDEIFELKNKINEIDGDEEPVVYAEYNDDEDDINTDIFTYLDKKLLEVIEEKIESLVKTFGEDNYTVEMWDDYKQKAEGVIRDLLNEEYYYSPTEIGQDWSLYFLADKMEAFEMIQASSNWTFEKANKSRFKISHLNNNDLPFQPSDIDSLKSVVNWNELTEEEKEECIKESDIINRKEAIEEIIEFMDEEIWEEIKEWFLSQFKSEEA